MPVPSTIADLSSTAALNSPAGSDAIASTLDDYLRATQAILKGQFSTGSAINVTGTTITIPVTGSYFSVTGTGTLSITGFSTNFDGRIATLKFADSNLTLVNSSSLILPNAANIAAVAGDVGVFVNEGSGSTWRCVSYTTQGGSMPSGTVSIFYQATAPVGWVKQTTNNDAALRVVSGAGGIASGATSFSTVFTASRTATGTVNGTAISVSQMPSHDHSITDPSHNHTVNDPGHSHSVNTGNTAGTASSGAVNNSGTNIRTVQTNSQSTGITLVAAPTGITINSNGSGQAHDHTFTSDSMDFAVKYCDVIICQKS